MVEGDAERNFRTPPRAAFFFAHLRMPLPDFLPAAVCLLTVAGRARVLPRTPLLAFALFDVQYGASACRYGPTCLPRGMAASLRQAFDARAPGFRGR